jgi:serine kinase of HPr protein (carbohydrate metabolism regulator)
MIRHAGLVATRLNGRWRGVLIEGPSGSGKSDLALRAIEQGLRLVSDDRTEVFVSNGRLFGKAPAPLAGLIEARGVGVAVVGGLAFAEIVLLARCIEPRAVERMPAAVDEVMLGVNIPALDLWPLEPSAPAKLILALRHLGAGPHRGYQAPFAPLDRRAGP